MHTIWNNLRKKSRFRNYGRVILFCTINDINLVVSSFMLYSRIDVFGFFYFIKCHYNIDMLRNEFPISREKKKISKSEFFINLNLFEFWSFHFLILLLSSHIPTKVITTTCVFPDIQTRFFSYLWNLKQKCHTVGTVPKLINCH
jgi:hypothetical protein